MESQEFDHFKFKLEGFAKRAIISHLVLQDTQKQIL